MPSRKPSTTSFNNISSDAVERATGRGWDAWLALLDGAHATALPHPEIAQLLRVGHGVPSWWSQMITVGYEQARGLRVKHQKAGGFDVSVTRTMECPVGEAYAAFAVPAKRRGWCPATTFTIRRATHSRSLRITWTDDTDVNVMFNERGPTRCTVNVEHGKLATATDATTLQKAWRDALEALALRLEAGDYSRVKAPRDDDRLHARGGARDSARGSARGGAHGTARPGARKTGKRAPGKAARGKPARRPRDVDS